MRNKHLTEAEIANLARIRGELTVHARKTPEEIKAWREEIAAQRAASPTPSQRSVSPIYGRSQIVCPHCQVRGHVHCETVKSKQGISGGKATGAILTGGVSLFATGLSRKKKVTQAHCSNCQSTWQF